MFPINEQFANAAWKMFPAAEQYTNTMKNMFPQFPINEQFANAAQKMFPAAEQYTNTVKNMFPQFPNNEQFANTAKANLETHLSVLTALATQAFESVEKLIDLNLKAGKASLEDSTAITRQLLSAKDPQEFMSLSAAQAQPIVAKIIAYSRHVASIAAAAQAESVAATEEQIAETSRKFTALVDDAFKGAPAGSENAMAIMKSAIANASAGYGQFTKATKQAVELVEANLATATNQFSEVTETVHSNTHKRTRK